MFVGLVDARPEFKLQVRQQNENMKIFLLRLSFSRFLAKTLSVIKPAMKKLLKNLSFEVDFKHNKSVVRVFASIKGNHRSVGTSSTYFWPMDTILSGQLEKWLSFNTQNLYSKRCFYCHNFKILVFTQVHTYIHTYTVTHRNILPF